MKINYSNSYSEKDIIFQNIKNNIYFIPINLELILLKTNMGEIKQ